MMLILLPLVMSGRASQQYHWGVCAGSIRQPLGYSSIRRKDVAGTTCAFYGSTLPTFGLSTNPLLEIWVALLRQPLRGWIVTMTGSFQLAFLVTAGVLVAGTVV